MTKRNDIAFFGMLLDAARRANAKADGVTRERYDGDDTLQLALNPRTHREAGAVHPARITRGLTSTGPPSRRTFTTSPMPTS
jgi:hypothetical protein